MAQSSNDLKDYVVVFRAPAAFWFRLNEQLRVNFPDEGHGVLIMLRTQHLDRGLESPLPGRLLVEVRCKAPVLEHAVNFSGHQVGGVLSVVAFVTNAAVGDPEPWLAFDDSAGVTEREFFQSMLPDDLPVIHTGRWTNPQTIVAFMAKLAHHPDQDRIKRAIAHYNEALMHWKWGQETYSLSSLYIGMETLTKVVIRQQCEERKLTEEQLAVSLDIELTSSDPCRRWFVDLEAAMRRKILFQGDDNCYRHAKQSSDGYEHGFMPFDEVRDKARGVRDHTAHYLRCAIMDAVGISPEQKTIMLNSPFDRPLGHWPLTKYVRGSLTGKASQLTAPGIEYPMLSWKSKINSFAAKENGDCEVQFNETITPHLADGVILDSPSFEVWMP